jgi:rRNA maturation endonuclease Nob1
MRIAIPFFILVGFLLGLLVSAYLAGRRRPDGWRCGNAGCGATVARANGKFCPTCGTARSPSQAALDAGSTPSVGAEA